MTQKSTKKKWIQIYVTQQEILKSQSISLLKIFKDSTTHYWYLI